MHGLLCEHKSWSGAAAALSQLHRLPKMTVFKLMMAALLVMAACTTLSVYAEGEEEYPSTTSTFTRHLWVSGPAATWTYAIENLAGLLSACVLQDLDVALTACDFDTRVDADSIVFAPYTSATAGPATGMDITYTVTTPMAADQVDDCVRQSPLTNLNTQCLLTVPSLRWFWTLPLPVSQPGDLTAVATTVLPLTGSTNAWELWYGLVTPLGADVQGALAYQLQHDLQTAVDAAGADYLVDVTGTVATSVVNAMSYFVPYTIWQLPTSQAAAGDAEKFVDRAMASLLPRYNRAISSINTLLNETSPTLSAFWAYFPAVVTPWMPVLTAVSSSLWVSGPAPCWSSIPPMLKVVVAADLAATLQVCAPGTSVYVSEVAAVTSATSTGPATGAKVAFVVSNTTEPSSVLLACAWHSPLTLLNAALNAALDTTLANFSLAVQPIQSSSPDSLPVTAVKLLPIVGPSFGWQTAFAVLATMERVEQEVVLYQLQTDLQAAADATGSSFVVVVSTDLTEHFANESSFYVRYNVWHRSAVPAAVRSVVVAADGDAGADAASLAALEDRVMASRLPAFNAVFATLVASGPVLQEYRDLFPDVVTPWVPLVAAPVVVPGSEDDADAAAVVRRDVGDYLLVFAGDAATWARVWSLQRPAVVVAVESVATARLARRTAANTVTVLSAQTIPNARRYVGGLQVRCRVVQAVTAEENQTWAPEQLASLLLQANYTAMESLYTTAAAANVSVPVDGSQRPGALATSGIVYDYAQPPAAYTVGVIGMSGAIVLLCLVSVLAAVVFACCRSRLRGADERDDEYGAKDAQHSVATDGAEAEREEEEQVATALSQSSSTAERKEEKKAAGASVSEIIAPNPLSCHARQPRISSASSEEVAIVAFAPPPPPPQPPSSTCSRRDSACSVVAAPMPAWVAGTENGSESDTPVVVAAAAAAAAEADACGSGKCAAASLPASPQQAPLMTTMTPSSPQVSQPGGDGETRPAAFYIYPIDSDSDVLTPRCRATSSAARAAALPEYPMLTVAYARPPSAAEDA